MHNASSLIVFLFLFLGTFSIVSANVWKEKYGTWRAGMNLGIAGFVVAILGLSAGWLFFALGKDATDVACIVAMFGCAIICASLNTIVKDKTRNDGQ